MRGPLAEGLSPAEHRHPNGRRLGLGKEDWRKKFTIRFDQKVRFELDGGARPASRKLRIKVHPSSVTVCVPPRHSG